MSGKRVQRQAEVDVGLTVLCVLAKYGQMLTCRDIAEVCGCSWQYFYQIEKQALEKLRITGSLADFLN